MFSIKLDPVLSLGVIYANTDHFQSIAGRRNSIQKLIDRLHAIIRHTDKHFGLIITVLCSLRTLRDRQTDRWTDARTDGCYQVHYLPALLHSEK